MDVVIGIAMTSRDARLLLVEGTCGDGDVIDHESLEADNSVGAGQPGFRERIVDVVLDAYAAAPANGHTVAHVALTRTDAVAGEAKLVLGALEEQGITNVAMVSSADALEAAADYTVQIADCDSIALCVVEPEETMLAVIGAQSEDGVRRLRSRRLDGPDAATAVLALRCLCDSFPEPIAEVAIAGSAPGAERLVEEVNSVMSRPVVVGDDAVLLLARGALLAGGDTSDGAASAPTRDPLIRTFTTVVATVVLIVAGSVFLALTVHGNNGSSPPQASTPHEHAAPPEQHVHTVVRKVVPLAGRAAQKSLAVPNADITLPPLTEVIRR